MTWETVYTLWASVRKENGLESYRFEQQSGSATWTITTAYGPVIDTSMRVVYGGHVLDIQSVTDPQEARRALVLLCVERIPA